MKYFNYIVLGLLLTSCNPFLTKELRHKNKCNRKLERLVKKCPEILNKDTTILIFDTTIVTNEVRVDTFVSSKFDTINIVKDKFHVKIVNLTDSFFIQGGCDSDTVYLEKIVKVPYNSYKPIKLTIGEQILNGVFKYWWLLIIIGIIIVILKFKR